jgi:hypothetical protein
MPSLAPAPELPPSPTGDPAPPPSEPTGPIPAAVALPLVPGELPPRSGDSPPLPALFVAPAPERPEVATSPSPPNASPDDGLSSPQAPTATIVKATPAISPAERHAPRQPARLTFTIVAAFTSAPVACIRPLPLGVVRR